MSQESFLSQVNQVRILNRFYRGVNMLSFSFKTEGKACKNTAINVKEKCVYTFWLCFG